MWEAIFLELAVLLIAILFSVRERMKSRLRRDGFGDVLAGAKSTQISEALTGLVAVAGGIYLSLVLVVTFLQIQVPEKVIIVKTPVDPLALVALVIAVFQPFLERLWQFIRKF